MTVSTQPEYLTCLEAPESVQLCLRGVSKVFSTKTGLFGTKKKNLCRPRKYQSRH